MSADKKKMLVVLTLWLTLFSSQLFAADQGNILEEGTQDLVIVVSSGAAGAILGLSTLSFVDRPEKHLKSIVIGGAIGIVAGVATVAFIQANKSTKMYLGELKDEDLKTFSSQERIAWQQEESALSTWRKNSEQPYFTYTFTF